MAVNSIKEKTVLRLEYDAGMVGDKQKVQTVTYSRIKDSATDESIYNTALAIQSLCEKSVLNVKRTDDTKLTQA